MLWFLVAGFTAVFFSRTAPFPFLLERFAPSRSLWHVPRGTGPPTIYLTYDDGPNPSATPALLDVLPGRRRSRDLLPDRRARDGSRCGMTHAREEA
jgi:hypothetical protein